MLLDRGAQQLNEYQLSQLFIDQNYKKQQELETQ